MHSGHQIIKGLPSQPRTWVKSNQHGRFTLRPLVRILGFFSTVLVRRCIVSAIQEGFSGELAGRTKSMAMKGD